MTDLEKARSLLASGDYTCVICREDEVYTTRQRGVKPLLDWLDRGMRLDGFSAADKVVGRGAAFVYVLLGVRRVHALVMSQMAREVLEAHGIEAYWDSCPPRILNRDRTGFCPIETAVEGITEPQKALEAIRARLAQLRA